MEYGKLRSTDPGGSSHSVHSENPTSSASSSSSSSGRRKIILLSLLALALIIASAVSAVLVITLRSRVPGQPDPSTARKPTQAMSKTCSRTRYQDLCVNTLLDFPGSTVASEQDLVHISFNMTLQHFSRALYLSSEISYINMDTLSRSAYEDCLELLDDSVDALSRSLSIVAPQPDGRARSVGGSSHDVVTWLSSALSNQDTCAEGFADASGVVKDQMADKLRDLSELVSNCLAIFSGSDTNDFSGVPIQNRRRLLHADTSGGADINADAFPSWLGKRERKLLSLPVSVMRADIIVSKGGNGTYQTISEAIKKAPEYSNKRTVIYVMAGRYEEDNLKVGRKKWNLMFVGDGKGRTIISGGRSILDKTTTFRTASFAASGTGFIARDITFENWAGPSKHQAVALRVGADHAVVYHCSIVGYQDTLYVHSNRQFFRECDVYGTVDFIFGNAAVVLQNCSLYARKPLAMQKNTVTAQNRKDPNQNTGISIHDCRILATPDLEASRGTFPTYLGRPWKLYSRVVVMLSYSGDHIHPRGWLEWNATFALDSLYYGEYMNYGPGAAVGQRVNWPGYRVITSTAEASKFTVAQFIYGSSWLPSTGVAFLAGLSV